MWQQVVTAKMKRRALEVLEFMEISILKERKMTEMSSGEARRFLIAKALVHKPKALILDEPTNSLDLPMHSTYSGKPCVKYQNLARVLSLSPRTSRTLSLKSDVSYS